MGLCLDGGVRRGLMGLGIRFCDEDGGFVLPFCGTVVIWGNVLVRVVLVCMSN